MYFMQESGEPLRLKFKKAQYGPYGENLRHVLNRIEGYYIQGYLDGGDNPHKRLELTPCALDSAKTFFEAQEVINTKNHLKRVVDLVDGFETPFGLELLSTVHWVAKQEQVRSLDLLIISVYSWNNRNKQFSERQIKIAYYILQKKGWINSDGVVANDYPLES